VVAGQSRVQSFREACYDELYVIRGCCRSAKAADAFKESGYRRALIKIPGVPYVTDQLVDGCDQASDLNNNEAPGWEIALW
jgi:hypothetical protein